MNTIKQKTNRFLGESNYDREYQGGGDYREQNGETTTTINEDGGWFGNDKQTIIETGNISLMLTTI